MTEQEHIGYKKVHIYNKDGKSVDAICKLRITGEHNEARTFVCKPDYAKFRCSEAFVISIHRRGVNGKRYKVKVGYSALHYYFVYSTNTVVKTAYDPDIDKVCTSGIHYFKTKRAAQEYGSRLCKDCGCSYGDPYCRWRF